MTPVTPITPAAAIARLRGKRLFPTSLSSAELAGLQRAFLERSFFSARNTLTDSLDVMQQMAESILNPTQERRADRVTPENPEGFVTTGFDPASARLRIQETFDQLGYTPVPGEAGTIKDLSSDARINLVLDMNVSEAQAYGHLLQNADPDFADAFPAQELVRIGDRKEPRDWAVLWQSAAAEAGDEAAAAAHRQHGRKVARKDSAIWRKLSRFDRPWPPFDYNSGMGLEDVTREEAMDLGVVDRDTQVQVDIPRFEGEPSSPPVQSAQGREPAGSPAGGRFTSGQGGGAGIAATQKVRDFLDKQGDEVAYASVVPEVAAKIKAATGMDVSGYQHLIDRDAVIHINRQHGVGKEDQTGHAPVTRDDIERIPEIVRSPDSITNGGKSARGRATVKYAKQFSGTTYYVEEVWTHEKVLAAKTMWKVSAPGNSATPRGGGSHTSETFGAGGNRPHATHGGKP